MMREDDVRVLADRVLGPILGPVGYMGADIEAGRDHDGDDSLFIIAHFRAGSEVASGKTYGDAHVAIRDALVERGEQRFPYFKYDYPDDDRDFDKDEDDQPQ